MSISTQTQQTMLSTEIVKIINDMREEGAEITNGFRFEAVDCFLSSLEECYLSASTNEQEMTGTYEPILSALKYVIPRSVMIPLEFHYSKLLLEVITRNRFEAKEVKTYVVKNVSTGLFKIGRTTQKTVDVRVAQWGGLTGAESEIVMVIFGDVENSLHKEFKANRIKGEWFELSDSDISKIATRFK